MHSPPLQKDLFLRVEVGTYLVVLNRNDGEYSGSAILSQGSRRRNSLLFAAMFAKLGACLVAVSHADSRTLFAPAYTPGMTVPCLQIFEYKYLYFHFAFAEGQNIKISSKSTNIGYRVNNIDTDFCDQSATFSASLRILSEFGEFGEKFRVYLVKI